MDDNESPINILWTNPGVQRGHGRLKSRWIDGVEEDARKLIVEIGWWMPWTEVASDICLRRPRFTQGRRPDDDDDDDLLKIKSHIMKM